MHTSSEYGFEAQLPQASQNCRYTKSKCTLKNNTDADVDVVIRKIKETGEDKIAYDIWKKVKVQTGNGVKEKMKSVREEENKNVFVEIFKNEVA